MKTGGSYGGGAGSGEQHTEMPSRGSTPRGGAINETTSNSSWNTMPPVCEPTKPSGTPASHGGTKGGGY
jgi:hypothetical protein